MAKKLTLNDIARRAAIGKAGEGLVAKKPSKNPMSRGAKKRPTPPEWSRMHGAKGKR